MGPPREVHSIEYATGFITSLPRKTAGFSVGRVFFFFFHHQPPRRPLCIAPVHISPGRAHGGHFNHDQRRHHGDHRAPPRRPSHAHFQIPSPSPKPTRRRPATGPHYILYALNNGIKLENFRSTFIIIIFFRSSALMPGNLNIDC